MHSSGVLKFKNLKFVFQTVIFLTFFQITLNLIKVKWFSVFKGWGILILANYLLNFVNRGRGKPKGKTKYTLKLWKPLISIPLSFVSSKPFSD